MLDKTVVHRLMGRPWSYGQFMRIELGRFSTQENPIKIYLYGPRVIIPRHEQNLDSSL